MDKVNNILEFGIKRENEEKRDGGCGVVFDPQSQKYAIGVNAKNGAFWLFSGGVSGGENIKEGVLREVAEESGLHNFLHVEKIAEALCHYHNTLKNIDRVAHATCYLVILKSNNLIPVKLEEHEKFTLAWATSEEILSNWEFNDRNEDHDHWRYFLKKSVNRAIELEYDKTSKLLSLGLV